MKRPAHAVTFEALLDLQTGHLAPQAAEVLRQHVRTCAECQAELASISELLDTMRGDLTESTTQARLQRRRRLFDEWQAARPRPPAVWQSLAARLRGVLRVDSRQLAGAAGMRSARDLDTVKLLYEAGPYDIDLRVTEMPQEERRVLGQVLAQDAQHATQGIMIQLLRAELEEAASLTDELGEFVFERLKPGIYDLLLETATATYVLPDVDLT